jgi:hypothetical protein
MGLLTISDEIGAGLTNDLGWGAERPAVDIGAGNPEGGEPRLMAGGVAGTAGKPEGDGPAGKGEGAEPSGAGINSVLLAGP